MKTKSTLFTIGLTLLLLCGPLLAQSGGQQERFFGGLFLGGAGVFNFDRDTRDLALHLGGQVDAALRDHLGWSATLGFIANVDDNDAFNDRSGFFSTGLQYRLSPRGSYRSFLSGGYALADGEQSTEHFGYFGAGLRNWYGEKIGWQLEARNHLNGSVDFFEVRLSVILR